MRLGLAGDPFMWKISQPAKCGPLTVHFSRLPSAVRMNAPFLVPTSTRTLLMECSSPFFQALLFTKRISRNQINFAKDRPRHAPRTWLPAKRWERLGSSASPRGFDRYPDFHSAHTGARIEVFGVALEEIRRFAGPRSGLLAGFGVPLAADGFDRLANPGNVPAMREDRVTLRGNADNREFTEKTGEVADLDSAKIADGG